MVIRRLICHLVPYFLNSKVPSRTFFLQLLGIPVKFSHTFASLCMDFLSSKQIDEQLDAVMSTPHRGAEPRVKALTTVGGSPQA